MKNKPFFNNKILIVSAILFFFVVGCEKKVTCTLCGGDGKVGVMEETCRACYGSGKISKSKADEKWNGKQFK